MYPTMGINAPAQVNYQYGNMYVPIQNYQYNMGNMGSYDYGYQGNSYMNPVKFFIIFKVFNIEYLFKSDDEPTSNEQ